MNIQQIKTLEQVRHFLMSTADTVITPPSKDEGYQWVARALRQFRYGSLKRRPLKSMI